jgi:dipeptidyl aminopeptidase/acylaminoacyl peptidase
MLACAVGGAMATVAALWAPLTACATASHQPAPSAAALAPSGLHELHAEFLTAATNPAKRIEYYWVAPKGDGPWPVLLLLHGHQEGSPTPGGRAFVEFGVLDTAAARGVVGVSVSQPGYGRSDGPADFMGPETVAAVEQVIRHLRAQSFVRGDRIALEGVSRGAVVASLVASRDTTIRAMVLISGVYDFTSRLDSSTAAGRLNIARRNQVRDDIARETDGTAVSLRARSALSVVDRIRTPALILNGEMDDRTDPEQARTLAALLQRNGVAARAVIYPEFGHAIPYETREREIRPFLEAYLK